MITFLNFTQNSYFCSSKRNQREARLFTRHGVFGRGQKISTHNSRRDSAKSSPDWSSRQRKLASEGTNWKVQSIREASSKTFSARWTRRINTPRNLKTIVQSKTNIAFLFSVIKTTSHIVIKQISQNEQNFDKNMFSKYFVPLSLSANKKLDLNVFYWWY